MIADDRRRSQTIADRKSQIADDRKESCFHIIADDRRTFCDLRSYGNQPLISDHLAVHVSLRLAKLPPERRTMSYRRIRAIDFH